MQTEQKWQNPFEIFTKLILAKMILNEETKMIEGYNNKYCITNTGKVFNVITGKEMKSRKIRGYLAVGLEGSKEGNKRRQIINKIHRLVATYFVPNPQNKSIVNHKDGNKLNNNFTNLEWVTISENTKHAYANGLQRSCWNKELALAAINLIENYQYNFADAAKLLKLPSRSYVFHFYKIGYKTFNLKVKNVFIPKHSKPLPLPVEYRNYLDALVKDNTMLNR